MSGKRGSNSRPSAWDPPAGGLPTELPPIVFHAIHTINDEFILSFLPLNSIGKIETGCVLTLNSMSGKRVSNPRPTAWDPPAGGLPTELLPIFFTRFTQSMTNSFSGFCH